MSELEKNYPFSHREEGWDPEQVMDIDERIILRLSSGAEKKEGHVEFPG
jgi:hypothetical protein